jgi:hypothetical protein
MDGEVGVRFGFRDDFSIVIPQHSFRMVRLLACPGEAVQRYSVTAKGMPQAVVRPLNSRLLNGVRHGNLNLGTRHDGTFRLCLRRQPRCEVLGNLDQLPALVGWNGPAKKEKARRLSSSPKRIARICWTVILGMLPGSLLAERRILSSRVNKMPLSSFAPFTKMMRQKMVPFLFHRISIRLTRLRISILNRKRTSLACGVLARISSSKRSGVSSAVDWALIASTLA